MKLFKTALALLCAGAFAPAFAQDDATPARQTVVAKFAESVKLDGKMGDPAWAKAPAYQFSLPETIYDRTPEHLKRRLGKDIVEKGSVKFLWNGDYLYVGAKLDELDVVNEGKEDQTHLFLLGDLIEVFLKPEHETYYWEIYGAANGRKTCYFFPSRARTMFPPCAEYSCPDLQVSATVDGTLNDWTDKDKGWCVEIAIPVKNLTSLGAKFDNSAEWTVLIGRYNYSRYLLVKENSSIPHISATDFHLHEDYARLVLEK